MDLSNYSDEELMRMRNDLAERPSAQEAEDPDAELKRKFAYVAERGDREDERRKSQNALDWLASNKSASLGEEQAGKLRGYAEQAYVGTKERTNDFTKEERRQRYAERYEQAKSLSDKAQFVVDEAGDDRLSKDDARRAGNVLSFIRNRTSKFDAMGDSDVAGLTGAIDEMYERAKNRRGHWRKFTDALARGHDSLATMVAQGGIMFKPGELTEDDLETIRNLQSERERRDVARPKQVGSVADIKSAGDVIDFIAESVGENVERMGIVAGGAALTGGLAGIAGAGALATTAAGIGGASAAGMLMNTGEAVGDQVDEGLATEKDFSRALALGQGFGYSVVDGAFGVTPLVGKAGAAALKAIGRGSAKTAATAIREGAKWATVRHAGKEFAKGVVGEAVQEPFQSGVIGRGRRWAQTGSPLREGETPSDAAMEAVDEAAGAAAAALFLGGGTVALNAAGARRRQAVGAKFVKRLTRDKAFDSLSGEHQALVARHLVNDCLLATERHAAVLSDAERAALEAQNADIEADLAADKGKGADNARKMLASITSDYALEDKATIVEKARKEGTLRTIDAEKLRATEREIRETGGGRVFAYYDEDTNQHLYRVTDGAEEVWTVTPPRGMKPAADGETAFATLGEALEAMSGNDAYNRARAANSASKREVVKRAAEGMYKGEVNLVVADGLGGIADDELRAQMARGGGAAMYSPERNAIVVLTDKISSLGQLYVTMAHEGIHRQIADYVTGNGETLAEGRKRLFGKGANAGAAEYAAHYGTGMEEANEEAVAERASVEDVVRAVRDMDRGVVGAGVRRVFDAVRRKMGADLGVSARAVSDADVAKELRFLWNGGYLGKTQAADAKVNVETGSEQRVREARKERSINDEVAEIGRESEARAEAEAASEAASEAEAATEAAPEAPVAAPGEGAEIARPAAPKGAEGVLGASGATEARTGAEEAISPPQGAEAATETETETEETHEAGSQPHEEPAQPEPAAQGGREEAEAVRPEGDVRRAEVKADEAATPARPERGAQAPAPKAEAAEAKPLPQTSEEASVSVPTKAVATARPEAAKPAEGKEAASAATQGGELRERLANMSQAAQMRHYEVSRLTGADFNEANLSAKDLEQFKSLYRDYAKGGSAAEHDAARDALKAFVNAHGEAVMPSEETTGKPAEEAEGAKDDGRIHWIDRNGTDRGKLPPEYRRPTKENVVRGAEIAATNEDTGTLYHGYVVSVGPKNVKFRTDKGSVLTFPRSGIVGVADKAARAEAQRKTALTADQLVRMAEARADELETDGRKDVRQSDMFDAIDTLMSQFGQDSKDAVTECIKAMKKIIEMRKPDRDAVGAVVDSSLVRLAESLYLDKRTTREQKNWLAQYRDPARFTPSSVAYQEWLAKYGLADTPARFAEFAGKFAGKPGSGIDRQGNPIDANGALKAEWVRDVSDVTDEDFTAPTRNVELPRLSTNVDDALGADGKPVVIKRNIFMRNRTKHGDLTPEQSRAILKAALYTPNLYGQNQKADRPHNWIVVSVADGNGKNRLVLLEVNRGKDNVEVVHWHHIRDAALATLKRQAEREGGHILMLPSASAKEAGGLSSRPQDLGEIRSVLTRLNSGRYPASPQNADSIAQTAAEVKGAEKAAEKKSAKKRKPLPPNKRPGWNTSYNAFAETTENQFAGEIVGFRKAQGYLLNRPTRECPLWDWYQNHKDDRSAMMFLFGMRKAGVNDGLETLDGLSTRDWLLERAQDDSSGYEGVADTLLSALDAYREWKKEGGVEGAARREEEYKRYEEKVDRENRFGDDAVFEEYALDELEAREKWDKEYAEALGFVMNDSMTEEAKFSPESLAKAEQMDRVRIDHHAKTFLFDNWDAENGILTLVDMALPPENDRVRYRVSEDGVQEIKETERNGQRNEERAPDDRASDAQGEGGAEAESGGERGEGEALSLESATAKELTDEAAKRRQRREIERRQAAPLKGGTGEVGQTLMDLGRAEGEDLFNRVQRPPAAEPAAKAAPSRPEAVAAMRTLGMDSALGDDALRAKAREWERHADDPRFAKRVEAARTLLADRAAKGRAELTDEDKARKALGARFKRGNAEERDLHAEIGDALRRDADGHYVRKANSEITFGKSVPPVLAMLGAKAARVYSKAYTIRKIVNSHGLTAEQVERLVDAAEKPAAVMADEGASFVILTDMEAKDLEGNAKPVMIWMRPDGKGNYIASAYSRTPAGERKYVNLVNAGRLLFVDRNKVAGLNLGGEAKSSFVSPRASDRVKTPEDLSSFVSADIVAQNGVAAQEAVRFKRDAEREYGEVVRRYTKPDGTRRRGWMKAPNGKPTNLTERQWVQVRTPAFKAWFGDWEALAATKDWLNVADAKPFIEMAAEDVTGVAPLVGKDAFKRAFAEWGVVTNEADGRRVVFPNASAGKIERVGRVSGALNTLFEKSRLAWSENDDGRHNNLSAVHNYIAKAKVDGEDLFVHFTVREDKGASNSVHAATVSSVSAYTKNAEILPGPDLATSASEDASAPFTDNKIAYFLAGVNPANVSKVVDENDEPKVVYKGYNGRDINTFDFGRDEQDHLRRNWFTTNPRVAEKFGDTYGHEYFLNIRNPAAFDAQGKRYNELDYKGERVSDAVVDRLFGDNDGTDGAVLKNIVETDEWSDVGDDWLVRDTLPNAANRIKSATDNAGAFDAANPDIRYKRSGLYTGSAADYEKPSLHAVGTGEGAQVYGWGLYASNRRGIAESYATNAAFAHGRKTPSFLNSIKDNGTTRNGVAITPESVKAKREEYQDKNEYWADLIAAENDNPKQAREEAKRFGGEIEKYFNDHFSEYEFAYDDYGRKYLYEQTWFTDRPEGDESHLLNWYKPVRKEQLKWVREQLAKEGLIEGDKLYDVSGERGSVYFHNKGDDAQTLYQKLTWAFGSPRAASEWLAAHGIDGVKYPADSYGKTTKNGDKAGWNYVSFRDDNIRVDHKWVDGEQRYKRADDKAISAMRELSEGAKSAIIENDEFGRISFPLGSFGRITADGNIRHGLGLLHIVFARMAKEGASLDEAIDTAIGVAEAAADGRATRNEKNRLWLDKDGIRAVIAKNADGKKVITGYEIYAEEPKTTSRANFGPDNLPTPRLEDVLSALKSKVASLPQPTPHSLPHSDGEAQARYKRGNGGDGFPRARNDDPDVAFGTKDGILDKTGVRRSFARIGNKGVMDEGARLAQDAAEVAAVAERVRRGDAPNATDLATLVNAYAGRLAQLTALRRSANAADRADEIALAEKAAERIAEDLRLAGHRSGHALQMLKMGVALTGAKDTYYYLESEVKAIKAKQGLDAELTEDERKMLEGQAAKLAEVNAALNAKLAEKDTRIADLEEMNRQLMEVRRQITRRVSKAVKERYGIVHEDAMNSALARLGKRFSRVSGAMLKRGEAASVALDDETRTAFSEALYAVGMDEGKARASIGETFGGEAASLFDAYLAELGTTKEARAAKSETRRRDATPAPADTAEARAQHRLEALRDATAKNLAALGEDADPGAKRRVMAHYLRDFMRQTARTAPSLTAEQILERMAAEAKALDPDGEYDAASMLSAVSGRDGFDVETRTKAKERLATLQKAVELAKAGRREEAARLAGLEYASDAELLDRTERELRRILGEEEDRLLELSENPPPENAEQAARIAELKDEINRLTETLDGLRSDERAADRREKTIARLQAVIDTKQAKIAGLLGKPVPDAEAQKAQIKALRRAVGALARRERVIDALTRQVEDYKRRIREDDFETPPRQARQAPADPDVLRLMAERERWRRRFRNARAAYQYRRLSPPARFAKDLWTILGEMKGIVGSMDLSSVLRQGGQMTFAHPVKAMKAVANAIASMKSEENARRLMDEIMARPNAKFYEEAGIDFTDWGEGAASADDRFAVYDRGGQGGALLKAFRKYSRNRLMNGVVGASERGFAMYLNLMMADVFDELAAASPGGCAANMTKAQLRAVGRFVNVAAQRADIDRTGTVGKAMDFLNHVLWSPRNLISRFQFLYETAKLAVPGVNPYGDRTLRTLFAKETARYLTGMAAMTLFAKFVSDLMRGDDEPDDEIELDPSSSQFLRVRFGDTRVDFLSGLAQVLTLGKRLVTGEMKDSRGNVKKVDPVNAAGRFLRTKLAPGASLAWDFATGTTFERQDLVYGKPFANDKDEKSAYRHFVGSFVPLTMPDVVEQVGRNGLAKSAVTFLCTLLGAGVNTYSPYTYRQLTQDFRHYRRAFEEGDAEERRELMRKQPMLARAAAIESAMRRVSETERYMRKVRERGGSADAMEATLARQRQRVVELIRGARR